MTSLTNNTQYNINLTVYSINGYFSTNNTYSFITLDDILYDTYYLNYTDIVFNNMSAEILCFNMRHSTICYNSIYNSSYWE